MPPRGGVYAKAKTPNLVLAKMAARYSFGHTLATKSSGRSGCVKNKKINSQIIFSRNIYLFALMREANRDIHYEED